MALLRAVVAAGCPAADVAGDTAYTGGSVSKTAARLGLTWVGTIAPRTTVVYRGRRQQVQHLAPTLTLKWRPKLGVRASALLVDAPSLGPVRLVVLRNVHGNFEDLVTNELACDLALVVRRKRSRWRIETMFRATKQLAGLAACQCWVDQALVRHVALVLLAFVVLQVLRRAPQATVGAVKARWQGEVLRDGQRVSSYRVAVLWHLQADEAHRRCLAVVQVAERSWRQDLDGPRRPDGTAAQVADSVRRMDEVTQAVGNILAGGVGEPASARHDPRLDGRF